NVGVIPILRVLCRPIHPGSLYIARSFRSAFPVRLPPDCSVVRYRLLRCTADSLSNYPIQYLPVCCAPVRHTGGSLPNRLSAKRYVNSLPISVRSFLGGCRQVVRPVGFGCRRFRNAVRLTWPKKPANPFGKPPHRI